ncbi:hypothetical protein EMIT0111MI5_80319 [Burkholderia sp. IT-111MI5]
MRGPRPVGKRRAGTGKRECVCSYSGSASHKLHRDRRYANFSTHHMKETTWYGEPGQSRHQNLSV